MSLEFTRPLAVVSCLFLFLGCASSSGGSGGEGGGGGSAGSGGGGDGLCNMQFCIDNESLQALCLDEYESCIDSGGDPETCEEEAERTCMASELGTLWVGGSAGIDVCFFVSEDGAQLASSPLCNIPGTSSSDSNSYDLGVDAIGRDENGQPCSFTLSYQQNVQVDLTTGAFGATFVDDGAELAFSGAFQGLSASGVAMRAEGGSTCTVGWGASRASVCDEAAINACLDLLDCCRAILVNPVFFQACDQVVLECNETRCRQVLAGYPQCQQLDL